VTPVASPALRVATPAERLARAPSRRHSTPPARFTPTYLLGRSATLRLGDAFVEPSTRVHPSRSGRVSRPSRGEPDPPLPGRPRSTCWTWTTRTLTLANQDQWWAPLLPGGPTLVGFSPFSNRLAGASSQRRSAYSPFEPCGPRGASPRARRSVTGTPSTPLDAVRLLSRIRRLSPPGGPSRTGSSR